MRIKQIKFVNDKTIIKHYKAEQPRGYNEVVEETIDKKSDLKRHPKFNAALERMAPHLLIYGGFTDLVDRIDRPIDKKWFDEGAYEDDPRYEGLFITGVIITGKEAIDGISLIGYRELENGAKYPLKTPPIDMSKDDPNNLYAFQDILSAQFETLETLAEKFLNGETGAAKQMEIEYDTKLQAV